MWGKTCHSISCYPMDKFTAFFFLVLLLVSCSGRDKQLGAAITERDSLPVMDTRGVTTLISDSGLIRYRIKTEEWKVFDRKTPPYWAFEKGVYLEKFDTLFQVEASIEADTAYFYNKEELWKLVRNVHIQNLKGEKFDTDLLYWDQNKGRVWSDQFIRIEQPDRIITGRGFESNQEMTVYTIHKPEGIFYVDEQEASASNDSIPADSLPVDTLEPIPAETLRVAPARTPSVRRKAL